MSFYDVLVLIALILWILIGTGILVTLVIVMPRFLGTLAQLDRLSLVLTEQILPMVERSDSVLDRVGTLADAMIGELELIDRTVVRATDTVERMLDVAEERVSEVNALMTVAIEEAEETFYATAGILRALRLGKKHRRRKRPRLPLPESRRRRIG